MNAGRVRPARNHAARRTKVRQTVVGQFGGTLDRFSLTPDRGEGEIATMKRRLYLPWVCACWQPALYWCGFIRFEEANRAGGWKGALAKPLQQK
jgi:hypothetical protein